MNEWMNEWMREWRRTSLYHWFLWLLESLLSFGYKKFYDWFKNNNKGSYTIGLFVAMDTCLSRARSARSAWRKASDPSLSLQNTKSIVPFLIEEKLINGNKRHSSISVTEALRVRMRSLINAVVSESRRVSQVACFLSRSPIKNRISQKGYGERDK